MYVRNFSEGIDVPWQDFFHTTDQAEVERMCSEAGMACEWTANGGLRVSQVSPAVAVHPRTGEKLFFNQVQLHHVSCLDDETRDALRPALRRGGHAAQRLLRRRHADPGRGRRAHRRALRGALRRASRGRQAT